MDPLSTFIENNHKLYESVKCRHESIKCNYCGGRYGVVCGDSYQVIDPHDLLFNTIDINGELHFGTETRYCYWRGRSPFLESCNSLEKDKNVVSLISGRENNEKTKIIFVTIALMNGLSLANLYGRYFNWLCFNRANLVCLSDNDVNIQITESQDNQITESQDDQITESQDDQITENPDTQVKAKTFRLQKIRILKLWKTKIIFTRAPAE